MRTFFIFWIVFQSFLLSAQEPGQNNPTQKEEPEINIYRNPSNNSFSLSYKNTTQISRFKVKVIDAEGQTIYRKTFKPGNEHFIGTIRLGGNASGVYFVEISGLSSGETAFMKTKRIVVD